MLLGLGVDLLSLPRLEALISRRTARKLAERICSSRELASFTALPTKHSMPSTLRAQEVRFLASRWAAKEAAYKALPSWPAGWGWKNLDLSYSARGKPCLKLLATEGRDVEAVERRRARDRDRTRFGVEREEAGVDEAGVEIGEVGEEAVEVDEVDPTRRVTFMVSLSHDGDMIVAAVVAQANPD